MGFTKLDDGLIFSSLMGEDDAVFKVWVVILSRTMSDGMCRISEDFLATITKKDDAEIERCLEILSSPDKKSRTKEHDGRRIERVDGGFFVLNYHQYREITYNEYEAKRKRDSYVPVSERAKSPEKSGVLPDASASASVSAYASDVKLVYDAYPTRCPINSRATGKTAKNKDKIKGILKSGSHTADELCDLIKLYVADCKSTQTFIKGFGTFLNNLPDPEQFTPASVSHAPPTKEFSIDD